MKIVVCVKYVPDAQADRRFVDVDHTTDRVEVDGLLSELDENAVEAALQLADAQDDATVTVLTMGPDRATDAIRKSLQMGADEGVHVLDDALHGTDAPATSAVLSAAIRRLEPDLVLTGMASTDGGLSVVPAMLAERLGLPQVTFAEWLTVEGSVADRLIRIERDGDSQAEVIEAKLPCLVSVTDHANEPRYPSFKGIMAAKKKPVQTWALADLGIPAGEVGLAAAWTTVEAVAKRPAREHGQVIPDEGEGGLKLVEFLAAAKLV